MDLFGEHTHCTDCDPIDTEALYADVRSVKCTGTAPKSLYGDLIIFPVLDANCREFGFVEGRVPVDRHAYVASEMIRLVDDMTMESIGMQFAKGCSHETKV